MAKTEGKYYVKQKNNGDYIYKEPCIKKKLKMLLRYCCVQVAATEGEKTEVNLKDDGLYVAKKIGSLRLPSCPADIGVLRILFE